jgi:hypothetical protein
MKWLNWIFGWLWKAEQIKNVIESEDSYGHSSKWAKIQAISGERVTRNIWPSGDYVFYDARHGFLVVRGGVSGVFEFVDADEASCDWILVGKDLK